MRQEYLLQDKVAVVTGAAKRVGKVIALSLAQKGCHIALHYKSSYKEASQTAKEIAKQGVQVALFQADLSKSKEVDKMAAAILKKFKKIDILVNNAAVFKRTPFPKMSEADWDFHLNANLKGPFLLTKAIAPHMLKRKQGKIVNFADWAGKRPYLNYLPYCVSKAGVICMTKALAKTLAPHIQVNAVAPGPVLLPSDISMKEKKTIIQNTPLKKIGSPQDIADAVSFLIEHSDFITGHILVVDGGRLIA